MEPTPSPLVVDPVADRSGTASEDQQEDSRSSSSTASPAPADNEESDFFLGANDSTSSLGVPNFQDMQVDDACWPPVHRLPNEILISIFSKVGATNDLYHCMLVSKRWARNAVDLLWHRPSCTNWPNLSSICQTLGLERPFFSYRDFIKRLNLAALADKVSDGSVQPLSVCTRVERLTLTNCRGLTDSGLIALVENSSSLLALDISNVKNTTERAALAIAEHCKRLQGLNISGCELISNDSLITLAENCRYIKRLKLNECVQLRDTAVAAFAEHCPNILEMDLHQCNQIGNGPVTSLISKGNCLRELRLTSCELIDDNAFLALPSHKTYEHLRILDLTSCTRVTDSAIQKIIDVAPRLRNLVLAKCRHITDLALHAIAKLGKNLHYMHLGHCSQLTDEGVKKLVSSCNRIRYIDLGCCVNLTDDSVRRLAMLPKLKRIGLVKCHLITDDSVFTLAEAAFRPRVRRDANGVFVGGEYYASSLERVHLSYCTNLTLESIMKLLNSCPRLTHLSLTGVQAFQREEFQPYCRKAPDEFTQHQRNVFCVFSGNMVSKFRDFLNTSPLFEDVRASFGRADGRPRGARRNPAVFQSGEPGAFDDDMADEENEYDPMDASELGPDQPHANAPNGSFGAPSQVPSSSLPAPPHQLPLPQSGRLIPVAPSAPALGQNPFPPVLPPYPQQQFFNPDAPLNLNFSSFISNQPAHGTPSLSAHGLQASAASLGQQLPRTVAVNGGPSTATGASTAPLHDRTSVPDESDANGNS